MRIKIALFVFLAVLIGGVAVLFSSRAPGDRPTAAVAPPIAASEHAATVAGMKPPKRPRPVVAIVAHNAGTEVTDYLVPYAVLSESGVADVVALATEPGPIRLVPALSVEPQATTAEFDAQHPEGADYVIVPKIEDTDNPAVVGFIRAQQKKGATIVGVCNGVQTLSAAGLLASRAATGHWYSIDAIREANPDMRWVRDRRYVVDRGVVTTTGVTASLPVSLALVEAIAGRKRARTLATELGVDDWDARHHSASFALDWSSRRATIRNTIAFWERERYGIPVRPGVDEIALAFISDAWSRTYLSNALAVAEQPGPIRTRRGLTLLPDATAADVDEDVVMLPAPPSHEPARALPVALDAIATNHGPDTAAFVALQLEYPWSAHAP